MRLTVAKKEQLKWLGQHVSVSRTVHEAGTGEGAGLVANRLTSKFRDPLMALHDASLFLREISAIFPT